MQRILPPILVAALIAAMIAMSLFVPGPDLAWPFRIPGGIVLCGGLVLTVRHARLFERLGTNIMTFNDPDQLVLSGAYRWTRNPMYLGFLLMLIGVALILAAPVAFLGPIAFFLAADRWYIPFEERRLTATFDADYAHYQRSVRRWIGRTHS